MGWSLIDHWCLFPVLYPSHTASQKFAEYQDLWAQHLCDVVVLVGWAPRTSSFSCLAAFPCCNSVLLEPRVLQSSLTPSTPLIKSELSSYQPVNHAGLWPVGPCWDAQALLWVLLIPWPDLGVISYGGRMRKSGSDLFITSLPSLLELLFSTAMPRKATGPLFIGTVWCVWLLIICFPKYPSPVLTVVLQKGQYFISEIQFSSTYRWPVLCYGRLSESILCPSELEGGDSLFIPLLFVKMFGRTEADRSKSCQWMAMSAFIEISAAAGDGPSACQGKALLGEARESGRWER